MPPPYGEGKGEDIVWARGREGVEGTHREQSVDVALQNTVRTAGKGREVGFCLHLFTLSYSEDFP